jgi:hypothetical protein
MKFNPSGKSARKLLGKGEYDFVVTAAEERISGSGNTMIVLTLKVTNADGETTCVKDYLLAKMRRKLRQAALACGLGDKFETGSLSDVDFIGRRGRLRLKVDEDEKGEYPDKNVVDAYIAAGGAKLLPESIDDLVAKYSRRA